MKAALHIINRLLFKGGAVLTYIFQYGCIAHCTIEFVGDFVICSGPSMEPTIHSNDIILTEHISISLHKINRGDIVVARSPSNPEQYICKRVVGIPGDRVASSLWSYVVPRGHVWLEGDNTTNSTDSRNYGPIPQALIRGKAFLKVWPWKDMQFMTGQEKKSKTDANISFK